MNEFFQKLKKDHKKIKEILGKLKKTKNGSKNRDELFQKLKEELVPHKKAEETAFYQPLLEKKEAREDALEGIEEHHVSDMVFKELERNSKDEDRWGAKLSVFKELVEHHIKEEEGKIFKTAGKVFGEDEFKSITKKFEQEKRKLRKNLK